MPLFTEKKVGSRGGFLKQTLDKRRAVVSSSVSGEEDDEEDWSDDDGNTFQAPERSDFGPPNPGTESSEPIGESTEDQEQPGTSDGTPTTNVNVPWAKRKLKSVKPKSDPKVEYLTEGERVLYERRIHTDASSATPKQPPKVIPKTKKPPRQRCKSIVVCVHRH